MLEYFDYSVVCALKKMSVDFVSIHVAEEGDFDVVNVLVGREF